jgi:drug/metabolite transporter (DMT)-like permease
MKAERAAVFTAADTGVYLVLIGAVFSGLRPLFARLLIDDGLTAVVTALYCYFGSALIFVPFGIKGMQPGWDHKRAAVLAVASGLFVGVGGAAYFEALSRLPVATVTLIYFTYPAWVVVLLAVWRRRWPRRQAWLGVACVLVGVFLIVGHGTGAANNPPIDFLIAFIAPLSWTVLIIFLGGPLTALKPFSRIGFITLGAVLTMGLAMLVQQPPALFARSTAGWISAVCLIVISGIGCHVLTTIGVQKAGSERASFAGAFEIATSLAIGWVIFTEPISLHQVAGVFLIAAALFYTRRIDVAVGPKSLH